jgi:hypothetical protein
LVELVLRRDGGDEVCLHDGTVQVGAVIQVNESFWMVAAEEEAERVGVSARYLCVPAD